MQRKAEETVNEFSKIQLKFFGKNKVDSNEASELYRKKLLKEGQEIIDAAVEKQKIQEQEKINAEMEKQRVAELEKTKEEKEKGEKEKKEPTLKTQKNRKKTHRQEEVSRRRWPNGRSKLKIEVLHAPNSEETLKDKRQTNRLDVLSGLPVDVDAPKPVIVDLGMGNGQFLIDLAVELNKHCKLYGVSASPNEIKGRACHYAGIKIIKGRLPFDDSVIEFLQEKEGKVDKIYDSYGPTTYANNPLHCLIYAALLLKSGGQFSAMTSTENNTVLTAFGDDICRKKITKFFADHLGIDIKFEFSSIRSELSPGKIHTDLLVSFTKGDRELTQSTDGEHLTIANTYLKLCRDADKEVGAAQIIKPSWFKYNAFSCGMFSIDMRTYKQYESENGDRRGLQKLY